MLHGRPVHTTKNLSFQMTMVCDFNIEFEVATFFPHGCSPVNNWHRIFLAKDLHSILWERLR